MTVDDSGLQTAASNDGGGGIERGDQHDQEGVERATSPTGIDAYRTQIRHSGSVHAGISGLCVGTLVALSASLLALSAIAMGGVLAMALALVAPIDYSGGDS